MPRRLSRARSASLREAVIPAVCSQAPQAIELATSPCALRCWARASRKELAAA